MKKNNSKKKEKIMHTKSGQKLWLDEGVVHATKFLSTFIKKEEFRELSEAEAKFKQLAASYLYSNPLC